MILDAIVALFVSIFGFIAESATFVLVPVVNLMAAGIEAIIGIFVSGFSLGRMERKKRATKSPAAAIGGLLVILTLVGVIGWFLVGPKVMNRKVTFVAEDGHSLPFAAHIIHTKHGDRHQRSDNAGNIVIPRFATTGITLKDPRYTQKTWKNSEIQSTLIAGRTILGSGLDLGGYRI